MTHPSTSAVKPRLGCSLRELWDLIKGVENKIEELFRLLETKWSGVLDSELYRYPWNRRKAHLKNQSPIVTECIET